MSASVCCSLSIALIIDRADQKSPRVALHCSSLVGYFGYRLVFYLFTQKRQLIAWSIFLRTVARSEWRWTGRRAASWTLRCREVVPVSTPEAWWQLRAVRVRVSSTADWLTTSTWSHQHRQRLPALLCAPPDYHTEASKDVAMYCDHTHAAVRPPGYAYSPIAFVSSV